MAPPDAKALHVYMTRSTARVSSPGQHFAIVLSLAWFTAGCPAPAARPAAQQPGKDPYDVTSAELVQAGDRDTVFVRRVRMFEEIAATISTDSLARLYVAAMDAPVERGPVYQQAIQCQFGRMVRQYGFIAPKKAIKRMEDSLFAVPGSRKRWLQAQDRWPMFGSGAECDMSDLTRAPDSLNNRPLKTVWP